MEIRNVIIAIKTRIYRLIMSPRKVVPWIKRNRMIIRNLVVKKKRTKPQIFLVGTPNHGNLGDQLIAVAELCWLRDFYPGYEVREFTHEELMRDKNCRMLLSQIKKEDIIFLHGGGNLNVLYVNCEKIRRKVISSCPENRIILFQQSIFYEDTPKGRAIKAETRRIYNRHKHFKIIARENGSYENAKEMFTALEIYKYPDMATYLFGRLSKSAEVDREGVICCIRKDEEKYYPDSEINKMKEQISRNNKVTSSDTHIVREVLPKQRTEVVRKLIDEISVHEVAVTDRFHGVVFSILSGTPCVVLRSADHKIVDGVKWFKDCEGIYYADSIEDVPALVEKAKSLDNFKIPDFTHYFEEMYQKLGI